jgi:N-acetylglucosamine-6-sulfatase
MLRARTDLVVLAPLLGLLSTFPGCGGGAAAPTSTPAATPVQGSRPNFVVVIADDMAYGLFGPGRRVPFLSLPNLEALAARGVSFDKAFVTTSLCSPSRATLLSGLYAHSHGVVVNEMVDLPATVTTYPMLLQRAGYETAFVGKWHMDASTDMPRPGFDYWLSFRGQGVYFDPVLNENGHVMNRPGYITDLLTDFAVRWLGQPRSKPFLLILSHKAPHQPAQPAPRHAAMLADAAVPEPASFDDTFDGKPAWQRRYVRCGGGPTAFARCPDPQPAAIPPWPWPAQDPDRLDYLRTLLAVDESLGRVISTLSAQGLSRSTYVVFLSDNGLLFGEHRLGDKRLAYEESIRIPFVVAGVDLAPRHVDSMVLNLDFAPTILDLAGVAVPAEMQGRSLARLLRAEGPGVHDSFLYEYSSESFLPVVPDIQAVRTAARKYVTYPGGGGDDELYDLATDPTEMRNLAERPEWAPTRTDMREQLQRLLRQTGAPQ